MAHDAPVSVPDTTIRDGGIFLAVMIVLYIANNITPLTFETVTTGSAFTSILSYFGIDAKISLVQDTIVSLRNILAVLALAFFAGYIWLHLRIQSIHHKEHEKYKPVVTEETSANEKTIQWQVVLDHVNSESPAEWKLAILEADNIFGEVLEDQGYVGETVAEKLKAMSRTRITSYNEIWEAHKLRNKIAHGETLGEELTKKIARDTVATFENTFRELGYL